MLKPIERTKRKRKERCSVDNLIHGKASFESWNIIDISFWTGYYYWVFIYELLQHWSDELINLGNGIDIDTQEWTLEIEIDILAEAGNIELWKF